LKKGGPNLESLKNQQEVSGKMAKSSDIFSMRKEGLISLNPYAVKKFLTVNEILYIFKTLGGLWLYDWKARLEGRVGLHAKLKSGRCSDGFLYSKAVLRYPNIRMIFAQQLVLRLQAFGIPRPDYATGIPDGATDLGRDFASIISANFAEMFKEDGVIKPATLVPKGSSLLIVEDFCTKGTGFKEAVKSMLAACPWVNIFPWELVLVNRGGLSEISVEGVGNFKIAAIVDHRIRDWDPSECPLCHPELDKSLPKGSQVLPSGRIKPKELPDTWERIVTSQI